MTKKRETLDQYKKRIASAGGKARAKKLTKAERREAALNAVRARWAKHQKFVEAEAALNKVKFGM